MATKTGCNNLRHDDSKKNGAMNSLRAITPWYYQALIKIAKPLYRLVVWRRHQQAIKKGLLTADYQQERNARFGHQFPSRPVLSNPPSADKVDDMPFAQTMIWCHAVSLGETNTIAPMLKQLLNSGTCIWLTNTTQTGYARSERLFQHAIASKQLVHTFVPVDERTVIERFVTHVLPDLVMFVETELWANTLEVLTDHKIPSVLVNARLSQKSFTNYQSFSALSRSMMQNISLIIAQDSASAKRFRQLGAAANKIRVADSLKWSLSVEDVALNSDAEALSDTSKTFIDDVACLQRPIWVAGSTHDKEEQLILKAHIKLLQQNQLQNLLLLLVPRHPERFDAVATLITQAGLTMHRRSKGEKISATTQVYLVDTMGELEACYQLADVAFVGGSLVDVGGHNPIEAAKYAKPVIMGEYTQSCHELVVALQQEHALQVIPDDSNMQTIIDSLSEAVRGWLTNKDLAEAAGRQGQQLVWQKQKAMTNQLAMVASLIRTT